MLVTASWGGAEVAVELDAECRSLEALQECLQEALPGLDVKAVRLEVGGRSIYDDEDVLGLSEGSVISISATMVAFAATTLREEGLVPNFEDLCAAVKAGDVRLCRLYLEAGVVGLHMLSAGYPNLLHLAVWHGHREICELLLAFCDYYRDATDQDGDTALHWAVSADNAQLCKLLLDSGCAKNPKNTDGYTPLHRAVSTRRLEVCKLLLDAGCATSERSRCSETPLHIAISRNATEYVNLLLGAGCEQNARDGDGDTPLHLAVYQNNLENCKLLLDADCQKDAKNDRGRTPLKGCDEYSSVAKFLRSRGCV
eukprot:Rhum_TRINITY_DN13341_c0_g3::Rhum_TRINITY_DN13341_c0_g3_i1::g.58849::m.58849